MSNYFFSRWAWARNASRDERGASAVEFALIAPIIFVIFTGIIEGSLLLHAWGNMQDVGRQAARSAAIGELTKAQAETLVKNRMQASHGAPNVTATVTFETGTQLIDNAVVVSIVMPAAELSKVLPFGLFRTLNLTSTSRMHWEMGA
ncbi:pilus assembly protein [Microvirga sp. BT689]|uniref:TadE/TadG family type IV pilus assembly protein n=1 Tax=Microvirga arvi TaxID=2778731 RepID=UPI00195137FF|nr:TadE/TadG family type IV pilus assembly protein [Microvirga arvi]MBM6583672.1 pilus assembly protein [Microvirga arvi]